MSRTPSATYRMQFTPSFGFDDAASRVPYLAELGIDTLYSSPVTQARAGSTHGYDVVDHSVVNTELGGRDGLVRLSGVLKEHGMLLLADFVPNHMAYDRANCELMDALERGPASDAARFFDIAWDHSQGGLQGRVLAPFLGSFYGEALEQGALRVAYDEEGLAACYYEQRYPLSLESYPAVFGESADDLEPTLGHDSALLVNLLGALHFLSSLAKAGSVSRNELRHAKSSLRNLYERHEAVRGYMDGCVACFNQGAASAEILDGLLSRQHYRLSFWKVASEEINYRRFFTINDLICIRVEDPAVYDAVHRGVAELVGTGIVDGLRIDHVDGLYDPAAYLARLRDQFPEAYLVVEKILEQAETLRLWPVHGTTGYDFLADVNGVLCDPEASGPLSRFYRRFTALDQPYHLVATAKKRLMVGKHLAGNIDNLAQLLKRIAEHDRAGSDITLYGLRRAMVEVMVHFPVYRTYVVEGSSDEADQNVLRQTLESAGRAHPDLSYEFAFISSYLLDDQADARSLDRRVRATSFIMQLQQLTGPLMAKGCEDTAFYVYNRLLALNEVGGDPSDTGMQVAEFHRRVALRCESWPHTMNATATHDTKRGEDCRRRIGVLSEMPREWEKHVRLWARLNAARRTVREGTAMPDRNDEYLIYQTLVGSWPTGESGYEQFVPRVSEYVVKAVREAKVHTAWIKPDEEYERACVKFVERILSHGKSNRFLESFVPLQKRVAYAGVFASLSQCLLKVASPGVPDFFQGSELWDLSMVDPDNRRPVDYEARREALGELCRQFAGDAAGTATAVLANVWDGRVKLFAVWRALQARRRFAELFADGSYEPVGVEGLLARHVIAFRRRLGAQQAIVIAPRLTAGLVDEPSAPIGVTVWQDTALVPGDDAPGELTDCFTGRAVRVDEGRLAVGEVLSSFPLGLLIGNR